MRSFTPVSALLFCLLTAVLTAAWVMLLTYLKQSNPQLSMSPLVMAVPCFLMFTIAAAQKGKNK